MPKEITDGSEPLKGRQETFCQIYSQGDKSAAEAYRQAGYSQNRPKYAHANAKKLTTKDHIWARIAYLQAKTAKKLEIDREKLAKMSLRVYDLALKPELNRGKPDLTAANGAITNLGRTFGLLTDVSRDDTNRTEISEERRREALEAAHKVSGGGKVIDISKARVG